MNEHWALSVLAFYADYCRQLLDEAYYVKSQLDSEAGQVSKWLTDDGSDVAPPDWHKTCDRLRELVSRLERVVIPPFQEPPPPHWVVPRRR